MPDDGWQPIKTAPRDGTRILVIGPSPSPLPWEYTATFWCDGHPPYWSCCGIQPTHWRPLPAPPQQG